MINKAFILAGKAIFTLAIPEAYARKFDTQPHYTFRVNVDKNDNTRYYVSLLVGPDNLRDYAYMGRLNPVSGLFYLTSASKYTSDTQPVKLIERVLFRIWRDEVQLIHETGFDLYHIGRCCRCTKPLTTPESVRTGLGPECRKILGIAA